MTAKDLFSRIWNAYEGGELLVVCAWCERVRIDGSWLAAPRGALAVIDQPNTLSHSICDHCAETLEPSDSFGEQAAG
jgi:hypothetical protein